jgi:hypothetical protein
MTDLNNEAGVDTADGAETGHQQETGGSETGGAEQNGANPSQSAEGGAEQTGGGQTGNDGDEKKDSVWAENWRDLMANGDDDVAKLIKRYGSPVGIGKALLEKEKVIRQGPAKAERPKDFSDEKAMADWRKAAGIPDDPSGYVIPETVQKRLLDEDKPVLAQFTDFAHKRGIPTEYVNDSAEWYLDTLDAMQEQRTAADNAASEKCEDKLRKEWVGAEFRGNIALAKRFIEDEFGVPYKEFCDARLPNGSRLGDMPDFIMRLSDAGRASFGDSSYENSDAANHRASRKAEIEKVRDTDFDRYERELSKEYREILEDEMKSAKR